MSSNLTLPYYFAFFILLSFGSSCQNAIDNNHKSDDPIGHGTVYTTEKINFQLDTLASTLKNPWGLEWLPDGRLLITEREGFLLVFDEGKNTIDTIQNFPEVYAQGQGGLLDVKLHPQYNENGWIYFTYVKPLQGGGNTTLIRAKLEGNSLIAIEELYQTQPISDAKHHFGSRIVFDNEGYLYFSTGDRGEKDNAQKLDVDNGKIFRIYDNGGVPDDNPFVNTAGAEPRIWSYGHRNPQSLVYDSINEIIWEAEHGPKGGDELNIIEKGKNYGWPIVTHGIDYDGSIISDLTTKEGFQDPVYQWTPSIATSGMVLITSDKYPNWKGNLLVGSLALQHVARVEIAGKDFVHYEKLLENIGRVRQIGQSPDGYIYMITEGAGKLIKIIPVKD